jgi:hypothetical protein
MMTMGLSSVCVFVSSADRSGRKQRVCGEWARERETMVSLGCCVTLI